MFKRIFFINTILIICLILFLIPKSHAETIEDEINYLKDEVDYLEIRIESVERVLNNRINDLVATTNNLTKEIDYLENEIKFIEDRIYNLEIEIHHSEDEIYNLKTLEDRIVILENDRDNLKDEIDNLNTKIDLIASNIGYITPMPSKTIIEEIEELNNKIYEIKYLRDRIESAESSLGLFFSLLIVAFALCSINGFVVYEYEKRIKKLEDYIKTSIKEK
jgi:chromosome segregation ATPase